jgi:hypothetical protein
MIAAVLSRPVMADRPAECVRDFELRRGNKLYQPGRLQAAPPTWHAKRPDYPSRRQRACRLCRAGTRDACATEANARVLLPAGSGCVHFLSRTRGRVRCGRVFAAGRGISWCIRPPGDDGTAYRRAGGHGPGQRCLMESSYSAVGSHGKQPGGVQ